MSDWDFYTERVTRSRTARTCEECSAGIPAGAAHLYCCGKVEGAFTSYRLCDPCRILVSAAFAAGLIEEGWPLAGLRAELIEDHGIADPDSWALSWHAVRASARAEQARMADAAAVLQGAP